MTNKKKYLKNILTTVSLASVIIGSAGTAAAASRNTVADPATIGGTNTNLAAAFANGDNVVLTGAHNLITGANIIFGAGAGGAFGIDVGGNNAQTFTINHDVTFAGANNLTDIAVIMNAGVAAFGRDITKSVTINGGQLTITRDAVIDVTINGGTLVGVRDVGNDLLANGGVVTTVRDVVRNVALANGAQVTQTRAVGGNLNVGGAALYLGAVGADIAGTVTINSTNGNVNTLHDAANTVTLTKGNLTMHDAAGAHNVTVTAGNLIINDITNGGADLLANGGKTTIHDAAGNVTLTLDAQVTQTGTVAKNLNVGNAALYLGNANTADIAGTVTINSTNGNVNTLHNATGAVTLTAGKLKMNDAVAAVTVTGGKLEANSIGGLLTVNNAASEITIGGNLNAVTFTTDNKITFINDAAHTMNGAVLAANIGTIDANIMTAGKLLTVNGQVGDNLLANGLKLLEAKGGANIELTGGTAYIKKIDIGNQEDATLKLSNGGDYKIEEFAHGDGKGKVEINVNNVVLKEGTVLGKADNKLKNLHFLADHALTLETGVNVNALTGNVIRTGITADADDHGVLNFGGTHVVDAIFNNSIKAIHALGGAAGKVLTFNQDVKAGIIDVVADGTIQFKANVTGTHLKAAALGGNGTIEFINTATSKADIEIGKINPLKFVKISGSDVEFTKAFNAATLEFTNKTQASTVKFNGDLVGQTVTTASTTERNHNISVSVDQNITGNIGTAANKFGNLIMSKDIIINVGNASNVFASITTVKNNEGTAILNKDGGTIYNLGDAANSLKLASFTALTTIVDGDTFAKNITVGAGKAVTFNGSVASDELKLGTAVNGANVTFGDKSAVSAHIKTGKHLESDLTFVGAATTRKIGESAALAVKSVNFTGTSKTISVNDNIYAGTIALGDGNTYSVGTNLTVNGAMTGKDVTLNLNRSALTLEGADSTLTGAFNLSTTISKDLNAGNIKLNSKLNLPGVTSSKITIDVKDLADLPGTAGRVITLVDVGTTGELVGLTALPNVITVNSSTKFVEYVAGFGANKKNIVLSGTNVAKAKTAKYADKLKFDATVKDALVALADENNTGDALSLTSDLGRLATDEAKYADAAQRAVTPISTVSQAVSELTTQVIEGISSRMHSFAAPVPVAQVAYVGVAAGDESARYGAWGNPFYAQATQKARKGISGFKSKSTGGTIGFDTMANDTLTIGAAVTIAKTDVKHKNIKIGDKTKADTLMFSIYGMQNVTDNWFVQGIASFGSSKIKNTEKNITSAGNQTATGKYDSMSYGLEALGGYNYKVSEAAIVTPIIGLGYTKMNDTGYKQTGTTFRNYTASKKSGDKFEGILGARASFATDMNGVAVTPELHGFVRQTISSKNPKVNLTLDGMAKPLPTKAAKAAKTFFNLGLGVTAKSGMMEYGAGYDAHLANKYVGHAGTLKVRVNF